MKLLMCIFCVIQMCGLTEKNKTEEKEEGEKAKWTRRLPKNCNMDTVLLGVS